MDKKKIHKVFKTGDKDLINKSVLDYWKEKNFYKRPTQFSFKET